MKRIMFLLFALSSVIFAAGEVLGDTQAGVTESGGLLASIMFIIMPLLWLVPVGLGVVAYVSIKKKKEHQHEELGVGDAFKVLMTMIIAGAAAFYLVGSVGKAADDGANTLADGNAFFLKPLMGLGKTKVTGQ